MKLMLFSLMALAFPMGAQAQTINSLVADMMVDVKRSTETRLAVLEFSYAGNKASDGPAIIQERITTQLVRLKVGKVVERALLQRVVGELKFQSSGLVDDRTIKQLGRILGVNLVVVGTLNDLPNKKTEVNARLVEAETAEVVGAGSVTVPKTWEDRVALPARTSTSGATGLAAPKEYMDAQLGALRRSVGKTVNPRMDGKVDVNGVAVSSDDFGKAVMETILNGAKRQGLPTPPMEEETVYKTGD